MRHRGKPEAFPTLYLAVPTSRQIILPYVLQTGAGAQSNDEIIANTATGVQASILVQALPNPFTNTIMLHIAQPVSGGSLIKVCDMQGRVLLTKQTSDAVISLGGSLSRGIYMVQVWQKDGLVFSQKLIKE